MAPANSMARQEASAAAANVITCPSCGRMNTPGSSFCATCGAALPPEQTLVIASRGATPKLRLIQEGGGDGEIYKLETEETVIGRNSGDIRFPHDGYMSGRHARIIRRGERFVLVDENSRNGTFKRIDGEVELKAGDIILIGKQLFRFEL
jgi:membrane protease subunit (stomatin/prohibitin family)